MSKNATREPNMTADQPLLATDSPARWNNRTVYLLEYRISQGEWSYDIAVPTSYSEYADMVDRQGRGYNVRNVPVNEITL